MTLVHSHSLTLAALGPLLFALSGCGDDFAEFSELPPGAGSGGMASSSAGSSAVPSPHGGSNSYVPSGGKAAGGSGSTGGSAAAGAAAAGGSDAVVTAIGGEGGSPDEPLLGSAGSPDAPAMALDLIDDMEGDFPSLPLRAGRNGGWFSVHDNTAGQVADATAIQLNPVQGSSHFAAGISGGGFTDWGAQMGASLKSPSTAYDASKYCGVRFLAKGSGSGWTFLISDRLSVPQGGVCDAVNWASDQGCYQFMGRQLAVGNVWQEVVIRFSELRLLRNPQSSRRLETSALYDILFNFYSAEGSGFELLVDDLSFIEKGSLACQ